MRSRGLTLLAALALAACGEAPAPPAPARPLPEGASAFRLLAEPTRVAHSVPLELVRNGIGRPDPRDAIPALFDPEFVPVGEAAFLAPSTRVVVVEAGGETRAYPLPLLDRHELVNDEVAGAPILVSWCPLCGSALVHDRVVEGHVFTFGVSGYLYRSDVLMYDRETESFWSQLHSGAVAGPMTGAALRVRASRVTSLEALRRQAPSARVLRRARGMLPTAAYGQDPYAQYRRDDRLWFPVGEVRQDLATKAEVVGVRLGDEAWACGLDDLRRAADEDGVARVAVTVAGHPITVVWQRAGDEAVVLGADGGMLPAIRLFWFAWAAFEPETRLWRPEGAGR